MRLILLLFLTVLMSCDSAGPGFRNAPKIEREVAGSRFTLRFAGDLVEAIRTSPEWLPRFDQVAYKAALVVEAERPGCKAAWVEGDPSMMWLGLSCNGAKAPARPKRRKTIYCDLYDLYQRGETLEGGLECSAN